MKERVRVFLADDHAMVREGLAALVNTDPAMEVVGQCGDGREVLPQVQQIRLDVLILDITMPGLNGLDVCQEVTLKCKGIAVLILTVHNNEQFVTRALQHGASGYLIKDAIGEQLLKAIKTVHRGELYLDQSIPKNVIRRAGCDQADPYDQLTLREKQVLLLVAEGKTTRQIADDLGLSFKTIDTHRCNMMHKLKIHDQYALLKFALRRGIVALN